MNVLNQQSNNAAHTMKIKQWAFIITFNVIALIAQGQYTERFQPDGSPVPTCDIQSANAQAGCATLGPQLRA